MAGTIVAGLASGFDWQSMVSQLTDVERAPERALQSQQATLQRQNTAYGNILSELTTLKKAVDALKDPTLFNSRLTQVGDSAVLQATADASAAQGIYTFNFTQLATASSQQGTVNVGSKLNATNDVSGLVLSNAAFATGVTAGTFTVNGKQVTIATSDTLQGVFDKISAATSSSVTATYNSTTDTIGFSGSGEIVLGSATDTSNFLQVAKLNNNGTSTVTSSSALGVVKQTATLVNANFATAVSDGGSGAGQFQINGVTINFNASTDTVLDLLRRINNSTAGVTATYDPINDRFKLTDNTTGDVGIALQDVTGNFLAASGLSTGALSRGKNLLYTINGGAQLTSRSNTITSDSSNLAGLTVTALKEGGSTTVQVSSDTGKIKTAITNFVDEYNKSQSLIDSLTASSTDTKGKVTTSILTGESDPDELASKLRSLVNTVTSGLSGTLKGLADLGIDSNGNDNTLALKDSTKLDSALTLNLKAVQDLFTNSTSGLAVNLSSFLDHTVGDSGLLVTKQSNLTKRVSDLDTQISAQEALVQANADRLTAEFVAMEQAQSKASQQLAFLNKQLAGA